MQRTEAAVLISRGVLLLLFTEGGVVALVEQNLGALAQPFLAELVERVQTDGQLQLCVQHGHEEPSDEGHVAARGEQVDVLPEQLCEQGLLLRLAENRVLQQINNILQRFGLDRLQD